MTTTTTTHRLWSRIALFSTIAVAVGGLITATPVAQAAPAPVTAVPAAEAAPIVSPRPSHDRPVSAVPVAWTPQILDGRTVDIAQVGDTMVVGGSFTQVAPSSGSPVLTRSNVFAFSAVNGAINTGFAPSVSGGQVRAVEPGPVPGTVYLGGSFQGVDGVTAKVVLLDVATGARVPGFSAPPMNGAVNDLQRIGDRLYVGGVFTSVGGQPRGGLVSLHATTGARDSFLTVALTENQNYTGEPGQARAPVGVKSFAVTPQGDQMAVIGNFRKADGLERRQMALIDLSGPTAAVRTDWRTDRYAASCFSHAFDTYVRAVTTSPDGSMFHVATTGGANRGTLCDTVTRWDVADTGDNVQPVWADDTGGDTLLSVGSSGAAVYAGGHQRWMNNHGGSDHPAPGAVPRPGLGSVDLENGLPIAWNPGRSPRGIGAEAVVVTDAGLWVGSDTEQIGHWQYRRPRLALFPVAGGVPLGAGESGALPSNVYRVSSAPAGDAGEVLYRVNAGGPALTSLDAGPDWAADTAADSPFRSTGSSSSASAPGASTDSSVPPSAPHELFATERWDPGSRGDGGEMTWTFPVPEGEEVVVRLYFANRYAGTSAPGQRVFDVLLEGQPVLTSYDIAADVGHEVGTMRSFTVTSDGTIDIQWLHQVENPLVNGIEILTHVPPPDTEPAPPQGLTRVWYEGGQVVAPTQPAPQGDIDWTQVRGTVVIDGRLYYGTATGELISRAFDGTTYGPATSVDPYNDPYWSDKNTGSGGYTYRGVKPSFYRDIPSVVGMAFDRGRLYYTRSGSSRIHSRAFQTSSGVASQAVTQVPGFSQAGLGAIFLDQQAQNLYFVNQADGTLSRIGWDNGQTVGTAVVVSGPDIDGTDWRSTVLFLADGPTPPPNAAPVAVLDVSCDRLECTFDATGSTDEDGTITTYHWDYGDGATSSEASPTHTYAEGTFTVTLTVTDDRGAIGAVSQEVPVLRNNPPTAVIAEPACDLLECTFDGSGSTDADNGDSVVSHSWDFGDGSAPSTQATPAHTYPAKGTYPVTLTVTDEEGATGTAAYELTVDDGTGPVITAPELVGHAVTNGFVTNPSVTVPAQIQAGDLLLLFVSTGATDPHSGPSSLGAWAEHSRTVSGPLVTSVYTKVADGSEAGQTVTVPLPRLYRSDLTLAAYRGVADSGIEDLQSSSTTNTPTHVSPTSTVPGDHRTALSFWADRSSDTTSWTAPAGVDVVSTQVGSGGGRVGTLLTQQEAGTGTYGGLTATTDATSGRGLALTVLLAPVVPDTADPADPDPVDPIDPDPVDPDPTDPDPAVTAPRFVAHAASNGSTSTPTVVVPSDVEEGDLLVLLVTTSDADAFTGPGGAGTWTEASRTTSGPLTLTVLISPADGSESGATISLGLPRSSIRSDLTLVAYRGVDGNALEDIAVATVASTATHTTPSLSVPGEDRIALSFWADRSSSTTGWISPTAVETISTQVGSGGGRVSTLLAQQETSAGSYGGLVATTNAPSARGIAVTMLLAPTQSHAPE
ncbi:MAG: PKD domain-containing protein [Actinomycetia bacterium]|nr:PKD domain-containing protein [Actinomycetes bacterium]